LNLNFGETMDIKALTPHLFISPQILVSEMQAVAEAGFKAIICNRPDGEGPDQPSFKEIEAAASQYGLQAQYLPAESGKVSDEDGKAFGQLLHTLPGPVLAYCRTGMRSTTMWALSQAGVTPLPQILEASQKAGFDMKALVQRIANGGKTPSDQVDASHDVVIVGGGAAGISVASSLLARSPLWRHLHIWRHRSHHGFRHPHRCQLDQGSCGGF
jgi:sulfide:quinone oxidoreductase